MQKSMGRYRRRSWEEKCRAVERIKSCRHEKLAQELGITKRQLYNWRREPSVKEHPWEDVTAREKALERESQRLKEALAIKLVEADFLKGCCADGRLDATRQAALARLRLGKDPRRVGFALNQKGGTIRGQLKGLLCRKPHLDRRLIY